MRKDSAPVDSVVWPNQTLMHRFAIDKDSFIRRQSETLYLACSVVYADRHGDFWITETVFEFKGTVLLSHQLSVAQQFKVGTNQASESI